MKKHFKVNFYPEYCCEICNNIINNPFDCPVCKKGDTDTDICSDIREKELPLSFICQNCKSEFNIINMGEFPYDVEITKDSENGKN